MRKISLAKWPNKIMDIAKVTKKAFARLTPLAIKKGLSNSSSMYKKQQSEGFINLGGEKIEDFTKKQSCLFKPDGSFISI